jgi:hypothetical protein
MENTNTNPGSSNEPKIELNAPISSGIPSMNPDLSTAQNHSPTPTPFMATKEESHKTSPNTHIQEAFKKEKAAMAGLMKKRISPKVKKILIIVTSSVLALAIIAGVAYYFISTNRRVPVTITTNQQGFDIVIDKKEYKNVNSPYTIPLSKGKHTIVVKKQDFATLTKSLDVSLIKSSYALSFELSIYQQIEKIMEKEIFFAAYNKELNSLSYFDKTDAGYGLKEFDLTGQQEVSLIEGIKQVNKASWSPTFRQLDAKTTNSTDSQGGQIPFIDKYGDGTKVNWVINLDRKDLVSITMKDLNPSIKNVCFNPAGDKIAYLFQNDITKELAIANTDGSNFESLAKFKTIEFEPDVVWSSDGKRIAVFANTENGVASNAKEINVFAYNFETRGVTKLTTDGVSTGALFSPEGSKLLYQSGNSIWLYDFNAKNGEGATFDLKLQANLANCAWVDDQSFVALSSEDNALYNIKTSGIKDNVNYQINTLPANIKSVLFGNGKIYLMNNDGVYQLILEKNI